MAMPAAVAGTVIGTGIAVSGASTTSASVLAVRAAGSGSAMSEAAGAGMTARMDGMVGVGMMVGMSHSIP